MALVGTVSGSNGTSTTAITGSLIIADAPASSFPTLSNGVKFLVSGSKNADRTDNPQFLFNIDVFHSGAIGSDQYMQFKPVNLLQIPTNTTASYIYTSGSTNDMYFTQYSGPYTNTTRLRWLESQMHTGLLHGGVITATVGGSTFNVSSGEGVIVSQNAFTGSAPYPTVNLVRWNAFTSQALTNISSSQITYVGINASGGIIQQVTPISLTDDASYISLGRVLHQSGSVVNGAVTSPIVSYGGTQYINDFVRAIGPLKVSGHVLAASGSTLSLTKTAGVSYVQGRNYTTEPNSPDVVTETTDTAVTVSKIYYEYVSGSSFIQDTGTAAAGYTVIDPTRYNPGGAGTLAPLSNNNKVSIQRVYWFPNSITRALTVYFGNAEYDTLDAAQAGISTETFVEGNNSVDGAILVAYILVQKNCSDLTNTSTSRIVQAGVFRGSGIGGGGGTSSTTTPGGLDTYVQFNDGGSTFGGDAGLTYNKTTDTLTIAGDLAVNGGDITTSTSTFNIANSTATTVNIGGGASSVSIGAAGSSTTFAGNITGSNLYLSGDIAVVGGDITSTATTFNLVNASSTTVNLAGGASTALNIGNSAATNTVLGRTKFSQGLSGSLTKLTDGTDYLIAGTGVTLSTGSNGAVTFTYPAGSNVTGSFSSSTSWAFAHGMNSRFVVIQAYDTSYNQIIPQNITLVDNNNATITFPTAESGYAVASIGGVGSYAASSSYSLTASYVNPLVQTVQVTGSISVTQDITGSGIRLSGDLAVNGGDITSTAGTLNIAALTNVTNLYGSNLLLGATGNVNLSGSAIIMNASSSGLSLQRDGSTFSTITGDATTISLGATPGRTTANIFNSNVSTMNIGGAATTINIGSGSGRTSVLNDLVLGTGNILVTNDATPITLISSGNIISKLDINNNATGHKFDIQDWRGVSQFFVGEDGNAELSGSIVVSGSTTMGATIERLTHYQSTGSVIAFNLATDSIFYVNNPTADITANFTGLSSILNNRIVTPTVILSQSATGRIVSALQIDGTSQTINWANGVTPSATANKQEAFGFSLIRSGSAWKVLGQLSTYG